MNIDKQPQTEERIIPVIEEKWDEFSTYIDDDISSLSMVAGSSVINKQGFTKAVLSVIKETHILLTPEELEKLEALKAKWEKEQWISVKDKLPEIDINDNWNKKTGQSKDVWTYSDFGMKKGRYFHHGEHSIWRIDGASCTNGIEVTHWMPLPQPPKQ